LRRTATGEVFELTEISVLVGRRPGCHIEIENPMVSAHHCQIFLDDDGHWYVKDLDSTNGTFVNDERVNVKRLELGDELRIWKIYRFRVESGG
jgi:pSer/pThr/pTyr-binding forkhead associated (FHA) protein